MNTAAKWVYCVCVAIVLAGAPSAQAQDDLDDLFGGGFGESESEDSSSEEDEGTSSEGDASGSGAASQEQQASGSSETNASAEDEGTQTIAVDAEAPSREPQRARPTSRLIEEIVVTAQKREQNLQDVPISVQAFSAGKLDARGITNQNDLQELVPTLNISSVLAFTTIYLRGIGTDAFLTADPSVATYIDGIYFPFALGLSQEFGVLERVEVLKGPQGTLFGRNTTGGALNIVTRDPVLGEFDAQANVTVANFPDLNTKAYVNLPLTENVAVAISPIFAKSAYYLTNTNPDPLKPQRDDRSEGVRVKLRWAPSSWFDTTVALLDINSDAPSASFFPSTRATTLGRLVGIPEQPYEPGSDEVNLDGCCGSAVANRVYYGTMQFFTPLFDIKILGSDQLIETRSTIDFDGSSRSLAILETTAFDADIQTAELQLISNEQSWGSSWLEWIVGAYYFQGVAGMFGPPEEDRLELILFRNLTDPVGGIANPLLSGVDRLDVLDLFPPLAGDDGALETGKAFGTTLVGTESTAFFMQSTITFTRWLDLTLGLRYQDESRELLKSTTGLVLAEGATLTLEDRDSAEKQDGTPVPPFNSEETVSPKVSIDLRPFQNDTLFYLSYQEATKSGTYNGIAFLGPATFADPETVKAWELGVKAKFFYGSLTFNGAIFDYDLEDNQVQFVSLLTGGAVAFENAEEAAIRGLDFDVTWLFPPNIIQGLVFNASFGWLETAEYTSYPNAKGFTDNSGITRRNEDFSGNRIVKTPEITATMAIAKSWSLGNGQLEVVGTLYHTDEFFYEPSNREESIQDAYQLWGAHASYLYQPWNVRVSVFGRNLTDQYHTRGKLAAEFGNQTTVGPPRTYGMRLSWEY